MTSPNHHSTRTDERGFTVLDLSLVVVPLVIVLFYVFGTLLLAPPHTTNAGSNTPPPGYQYSSPTSQALNQQVKLSLDYPSTSKLSSTQLSLGTHPAVLVARNTSSQPATLTPKLQGKTLPPVILAPGATSRITLPHTDATSLNLFHSTRLNVALSSNGVTVERSLTAHNAHMRHALLWTLLALILILPVLLLALILPHRRAGKLTTV